MHRSLSQLQESFGLGGKITFATGQGGLVKATLKATGGAAEIYLQGAHVTDFTPEGHEPVLWISKKSMFEKDKPIRGGVPICWPWFGAPLQGDGPGHGFARFSEWQVVDSTSHDDGRVSLSLQLLPDAYAKAHWDKPFKLTYKLTVGQKLEMSLTTAHTGDAAAESLIYTEALHSYFNVSDVRQVSITGLENNAFVDKMQGGAIVDQGDQPVRFSSETDRVYQGPAGDIDSGCTATCISHDPGLRRRIVIEKSGSKSTVVWNPWIDKAGRMEDFGDEEWPGMHCIETANALGHAVTVKHSESHTITAKISVESA